MQINFYHFRKIQGDLEFAHMTRSLLGYVGPGMNIYIYIFYETPMYANNLIKNEL